MKTSTLFVVGLIVGALVVFGIRAISETEGSSAEAARDAGPPEAPDAHAGHGADLQPAPAPAPAPEPARPPAGEHDGHDPHAGHDMRKPENEICPVMGNEVDPDVYVDYKGRRIGFCCPGCDKTFLKDPEKYLKKVDAEIAARKGGK